jgi:colanic acid biosynthesis glycosyl transferase WcaI
VEVIHNWADGTAIRRIEPGESRFRAENGWADRFVVLYSGNMGAVHEFETILEAAGQLRDRPEILFVFMGHGVRRSEVEESARHRGLRNVVFHDPVPKARLGDALAAGDLHCVTLRSEMAGVVVPSKLYGILAAGRPVLYLGPAEGEAFDIVKGGCGTHVRIGDAAGLASAVRAYADAAARCREEGIQARRVFEAGFTRERQVRRLWNILRSLDGAEAGQGP